MKSEFFHVSEIVYKINVVLMKNKTSSNVKTIHKFSNVSVVATGPIQSLSMLRVFSLALNSFRLC